MENEKYRKPIILFPIGPRLQRLYANKDIAAQMRWHYENPRANGIMSHPSDGEAWKHFDKQHPDFANDPRNVRLGLCTDGFSPFNRFGKQYSCWPVMLTPYNLPPWLCMKRQFIFLSLIISGPKNPKKNLDIYLQPLVQELKDLWKNGLLTYDVSRKQNFDMRAALLWTINDFPKIWHVIRVDYGGSKHACPYCLVNECKSFWLKHSKKWSWFDCHRQFLLLDHVFRKDNKHFRKDRPVGGDFASTRLTGEEVWEHVQHLPSIVDATDEELLKLKMKREGWWKRSIFWDLPYWKTLLIRHNLDVLHIEKNFFEQMIHTIMDEKNKTSFKPNAQKDFKLICKARRKGDMIVLKKEEKRVLCNWICSLKFPDGYASDLSRCVDLKDLRLHGMKSHDCHVFMERLLPVALKHLLPKNEWCAITEISQFFRDVCASTLQIDDMTRLKNNIAKIMSKLEKIFPPSFFNSMEHLPVHLPYEAKVGGPVQYRWMYPFERFLNHLKRKTGNKARVEGSICNAYLLEEISNFCSLYYEKHIDTKAKQLDVNDDTMTDDLIISLAMGPSREVRTWKRYSINGYNFRAFKDGKDVSKATLNNGVCVSSTEGADYYGTLDEVIELTNTGDHGSYVAILFKCDWLDNSARGMVIHEQYKLVDVNRKRKYTKYEPFVLAYQVEQLSTLRIMEDSRRSNRRRSGEDDDELRESPPQKLRISIEYKWFEHPEVSKLVTKTVKGNYHEHGPNWSETKPARREQYWKWFKVHLLN
ncbi:uncharacterized protein LOC141658307 [Silene latifolia]|uniref:uncharacterized protein LOC141658307 n=1 Tax=Silene latifolia TaxID=37657 RepID=UPI003D77778C